MIFRFFDLTRASSRVKGVFSWGGENFWVSHRMCRKDVGRGFLILIKKQITEPIKKLRDKSNVLINRSLAHVGYCST